MALLPIALEFKIFGARCQIGSRHHGISPLLDGTVLKPARLAALSLRPGIVVGHYGDQALALGPLVGLTLRRSEISTFTYETACKTRVSDSTLLHSLVETSNRIGVTKSLSDTRVLEDL